MQMRLFLINFCVILILLCYDCIVISVDENNPYKVCGSSASGL